MDRRTTAVSKCFELSDACSLTSGPSLLSSQGESSLLTRTGGCWDLGVENSLSTYTSVSSTISSCKISSESPRLWQRRWRVQSRLQGRARCWWRFGLLVEEIRSLECSVCSLPDRLRFNRTAAPLLQACAHGSFAHVQSMVELSAWICE